MAAISIFNTHHPLLSQSLCDPVNVTIMLHRESVITQQVLTSVESASPSIPKQREVLLDAIREVIRFNYNALKTFASVLCKFTHNAPLGTAIQRDYGKYSVIINVLLLRPVVKLTYHCIIQAACLHYYI